MSSSMPCTGATPGRQPAAPAARVAAGLLLALAAGCGPGGGAGGRSALLITLDTTRADALSCYGVHPGVTPHLDRLAAEGILFEDAYTVAPITAPCR